MLRGLGIRQVDAVALLDLFMVAGVVTVLVTRLYLYLTGYPQVGNGVLHIAHAVWGGLLMAVAIMAALALLSRPARPLIALLGGIGFGLFIDELGKFITQDVDYFFKPTASLIYVTFVVMYLGVRFAVERPRVGQMEWLANAADIAGETSSRPLTPSQRDRLAEMLDSAPQGHPLTTALWGFVESAPTRPEPSPSRLRLAYARALARYRSLVTHGWFARLVTIVALFYALGAILQIVTLVVAPGDLVAADGGGSNFVQWSATIASIVQGVLTIVGAVSLRRSRQSAYLWFERALLVNILLVQVFLFAEQEFAATLGVIASLLALGVIRTLRAAEVARERTEAAPVPEPSPA